MKLNKDGTELTLNIRKDDLQTTSAKKSEIPIYLPDDKQGY